MVAPVLRLSLRLLHHFLRYILVTLSKGYRDDLRELWRPVNDRHRRLFSLSEQYPAAPSQPSFPPYISGLYD